MSRERVTNAYVERLAAELPERDLALVETLDRFRVATPNQLQAAALHQRHARLPTLARSGAGSGRSPTLRVVTVLERRIGGGRRRLLPGGLRPRHGRPAARVGLRPGRRAAAPASLDPRQPVPRPRRRGDRAVRRAAASGRGPVAAKSSPSTPSRCAGGASPGVGGATVWLKPDAFVRFGVGRATNT